MANRTGVPLTVYLPPELSQALQESAERNRRTKTAQVILAIERLLADEAGQAKPQTVVERKRGRPAGKAGR